MSERPDDYCYRRSVGRLVRSQLTSVSHNTTVVTQTGEHRGEGKRILGRLNFPPTELWPPGETLPPFVGWAGAQTSCPAPREQLPAAVAGYRWAAVLQCDRRGQPKIPAPRRSRGVCAVVTGGQRHRCSSSSLLPGYNGGRAGDGEERRDKNRCNRCSTAGDDWRRRRDTAWHSWNFRVSTAAWCGGPHSLFPSALQPTNQTAPNNQTSRHGGFALFWSIRRRHRWFLNIGC